ncbi:MAG: (Fe-S)-binding protein [Gemmatimonadetes bacterium]|nr:(Fe-S)-binding protein [Gemmatimonadota bacterium]
MSRTKQRLSEYARTLDCVHCGLCLPHCPTYGVTSREADSPRGRIYLMRGWAEGRLDFDTGADSHLDSCLVCRACESVCPSGIRMDEMMESFRAERPGGPRVSPLGRFLLREIIPNRRRVAAATKALELYERSGLPGVTQRVLDRVAPPLARAHAMRPRIEPRTDAIEPGSTWKPTGVPRAKVGLFLGCVAAEWLAPVHRATVKVLLGNGCEVVVPESQTCCGALHRHAGLLDDARTLLDRNARAFPADLDAVIVNAAGCGASLTTPFHDSDSPGANAAAPRATPYRDVAAFLHELGWTAKTRPLRRRVAYDQPCHLVHGQRVPAHVVTDLLQQIPGLELVPLAGSERCCGAGGVYNLLQPTMADAVLAEKVDAIVRSGANTVVTGNPGCLLQLRHGLRDHAIEVRHPIEVLADGLA